MPFKHAAANKGAGDLERSWGTVRLRMAARE
jgi:hypothetical protein